MKRYFIFVICLLASSIVRAQSGIDAVLLRVEQASKELQAQRELTSAQTLEAKSGNYLENPSVTLESLWGGPKNRGDVGELAVVQAFDFPTAYVSRHRLAQLKTKLYDTQSLAYRQSLLLNAKQVCIEIIYLNKQAALLDERLLNAERLAQLYRKQKEIGESTILETNKIEIELILATSAWHLNATALNNQWQALGILLGEEQTRDAQSASEVEPRKTLTPELANYPLDRPLPDFEQLLILYQENNPDLQALSQTEAIDRQSISVNRAQSLPKFEMGYRRNYGQEGQFNGLVVGMSVPLFENKNKVKAAKAMTRFSSTRLQTAKANSNRDLRQDYEQALTLRTSTQSLRNVVEQQNTLQILNKALAAGELSVINYFTEVNSLYISSEQLLQLEREYQLTLARMLRYEL